MSVGGVNPASRVAQALYEALSLPLKGVVTGLGREEPDAPLATRGPEVNAAVRALRREPRPLERPVLVLSGYRAWPMMAATLRHALMGLTSGDPSDFCSVSYPLKGDFDTIVAMVRSRLSAWDASAARGEREIDVVGISMGGLVGRALAMGWGGTPVRVRLLFTLGTPHRGARLAERIAPDAAARGMRPGSVMLRRLDEALPRAGYTLIPYAVLNDTWVGATRSSPAGVPCVWTPGARVLSHFTVSEAPGIIADVARRLRGEAPIAGPPSAPPRD